MSKRSGFAVKITAFIEADPKDAGRMGAVIASIEEVGISLMAIGIHGAKVESRFMLSREVPDEPVKAQPVVPVITKFSDGGEYAGATITMKMEPEVMTTPTPTGVPEMPPIPATLKR